MSVVIRGMTMPKDCGECKIFNFSAGAVIPHYFCGVNHKYADPWKYGACKGERPDWCPLEEGDDEMTIYGYSIKDLAVFAEACRKEGIKESEMHNFVLNVGEAVNVVLKARDEMLRESVERIIKGGGKNGLDN